jgi:glutathione S-transferase
MIELYGHPFSAFTWKPLIAAYARMVPFAFRAVGPDHPDNAARLAMLSPTGQMPALVDGSHEVIQSNAIIEYLERVGDAPPLIPADRDAALRARMFADVFDDYVAAPMQRIVAESFRPDGQKDPCAVAQARETLDRSYRWLCLRIGDGWAASDVFTIADCAAAPALFYADWVHPIPSGPIREYRVRLLAHAAVARVVDEARPYRAFFPLGAPDRD